MNKTDTNPTHTPTETSSANNNVIFRISRQRRSVGESQAGSSTGTDALSDPAIDVSALESRIKQLPEIDAARVVELHNRILAGEYEIDSEQLAGKLIDLEAAIDS
ncbi:MAG: flagellar biosynthesis anti-sigma factor FlgM [Gammaproteobacteria bacterium]|nr:flagellar biosynthesis anti-sigma factor FlgM [Gammaproteobacteria bacterium]MDD9896439.1 flagellar biosynthesis anti-sigma factor FlgM [Gammaproteobacteria bacterium]MDD9957720.1 flagellar biosynthesis anti-sigma factor FlgM [Gammaproteobacteria bacterium]